MFGIFEICIHLKPSRFVFRDSKTGKMICIFLLKVDSMLIGSLEVVNIIQIKAINLDIWRPRLKIKTKLFFETVEFYQNAYKPLGYRF